MQISFDFDYAAILVYKTSTEALIYCYNGFSKVAFQTIKLGQVTDLGNNLPQSAELPLLPAAFVVSRSGIPWTKRCRN